MKLLAVRLARSIWIIPPYFLNPKGMFLYPAIEAMKARYSFLKTPLDGPLPPPPNDAYKFEHGAFDGGNGLVEIVGVIIHGDGIVIDTRSSTDDGDSFFQDVIAWGHKEYGLPAYSDLPFRKIYASELNVTFSNAPAIFNPKLAPFLDEVRSSISDESTGPTDFLSFQLGTDQTRSNRPMTFRFDREAGTRIDENRYWSYAPTKTSVHIKLLKKLEKVAI